MSHASYTQQITDRWSFIKFYFQGTEVNIFSSFQFPINYLSLSFRVNKGIPNFCGFKTILNFKVD